MNGLRILTLLAVAAMTPAALAQDGGEEPAASAEATAPEAPSAGTTDAQPTTGSPSVAAPEDEVGGTAYVTGQPEGSMFSSDLVGWSVYGTDGEKIGDINDLLITGDGRVAAVVIGVGGFLGVGEKDVALPLTELDLTMEDGEVTMTVATTEAELEAAPGFVRADGTTSDRLGAFQRSFERTRRDAEELLDTAGERAGELYEQAEEATRQAQEGAQDLIERGREAVRVLRGEGEGEGEPAQQ